VQAYKSNNILLLFHLCFLIPALPYCKTELKVERPLSTDYPQTLNTLGDHIRKKRLDLGLLQKDVAQIIGTSTDTICYWENNRAIPYISYIPNIIKFLGYVPFETSGNTLRETIATSRKLSGLSQRKFARLIGIDPSTLGRWELGKSTPRPDTLEKLKFYKVLSNE
jgi:transcriptional regulator with XRE-family HTH domain